MTFRKGMIPLLVYRVAVDCMDLGQSVNVETTEGYIEPTSDEIHERMAAAYGEMGGPKIGDSTDSLIGSVLASV